MGSREGLGGLYRVLPSQLPGPTFSHILASEPYLRPNEGLFGQFYEVSQIGSRIDLRMDPELTSFDPKIDLSRLVPRCPSDAHIPTLRKPMVQNRRYLMFLLTVAERKDVPSKDWIPPPTQSQE